MLIKQIVEKLSLENYPVGFGGCRNEEKNFECCEYDITIFDEKNENDSIHEVDGDLVKLHHGSLNETRPEVTIHYENMQILYDESWDLKIFLSKIKERKKQIFNSYFKKCLVDAAICITKVKEGIKNEDLFTSSWIKCAVYFIADAISIANSTQPSPAHLLEDFRNFKKNRINEKFSVVNDCLGIERATPSLLSRMTKSTIGFSDMVEKNHHSKIIQKKSDYLIKNSLLSDCYFYLGYINRNNFIKIKYNLYKQPELIHILKIAFDIENDMTKLESQISMLHKTTNNLLTLHN